MIANQNYMNRTPSNAFGNLYDSSSDPIKEVKIPTGTSELSPGGTTRLQKLIDKKKSGFPLDPQEQKTVYLYENGYIDANGNMTGKQMPAGGFQF